MARSFKPTGRGGASARSAAPAAAAAEPAEDAKSEGQADSAPPSASREALVEEITDWCRDTRTFWEPVFERIRKNMRFAGGDQWPDEKGDSGAYQVNFIPQQLAMQQATIYAQNPTLKCTRAPRLEYTVWDGTRESLERAKAEIEQAAQAALQSTAGGGAEVQPPPEAAAIITDYATGLARKKLLDRIATSLEMLFKKQWDQQTPDFESQMKKGVVREKTTGVCFVAVKFERQNESVPTVNTTNATIVDQLNAIRAKAEEITNGENYSPDSACHEELAQMLQTLAQQTEEGGIRPKLERLVFDFKPTTSILVDPMCRSLDEFQGARRIAEQLMLTPEQVMAQWDVDVKKDGVVKYGEDGEELRPRTRSGKKKGGGTATWDGKEKVCVWIVYDKDTQIKYAVCDGYDDFLEEPDAPWPPVAGFWHIASLKYRHIEVEENRPKDGITIYGQSDVELLRPMQQEMNRSQEAKRNHRRANRPGYICAGEQFTEVDRQNISNRGDNDVIPLKSVQPGTDLRGLLMAIPAIPLDPALYEDTSVMRHVALVVGSQAANLGQQMAGEKATGQAIAEQGRIQANSSDVDSQDKFLNVLVRIGGEMMLREMSVDTVKRLVGQGAAWPTRSRAETTPAGGSPEPGVISRDDCIEELLLQVEAASAGRPNRGVEIQNFERMAPMLMAIAQQLGLPLDPLLRQVAKIMDFRFDLDEWLASKVAGPPPNAVAGPQPNVPPGAPAMGMPGAPAAPAPAGATPPLPSMAQRMAPGR